MIYSDTERCFETWDKCDIFQKMNEFGNICWACTKAEEKDLAKEKDCYRGRNMTVKGWHRCGEKEN